MYDTYRTTYTVRPVMRGLPIDEKPQAAPAPEPKAQPARPRIRLSQSMVMAIMKDGRERTSGDVATRTGATVDQAIGVLRRLHANGKLVVDHIGQDAVFKLRVAS